MSFLMYVYQEHMGIDKEKELLNKLAIGRDKYLNDRNILDTYLKKKKEKSSNVYEAIRSLEFDKWVYLRDTTKYSLFVRGNESASYAVLGLTQPIKEIFGYSGIYLETGVMRLESKFVCDGLITNQVQLGKNYCDHFNSVYKNTKSIGKFYKN